MGTKALYTDTRRKLIRELIITRDIENIKGVLHDRNEYKKFSKGWQAVNLDEYVAKLDIKDDTFNMTKNRRKITFFKDDRAYAIVAAIGGKYFRVQEINSDGTGGKYVNLDFKDPSMSGKFQRKKRKAEWLRLTHFKITYKKGTA